MTIIRVMSFNIFSPGELEEGEELPLEEVPNSWEDRAPLNIRTIKRYRPDLIGFQEMEAAKLATYQEQLAEYSYAEPDHAEDVPTIFWRRDTCDLVRAGQFWLSRTPDVRSNDWDVPYPLRVDWVKVRLHDTDTNILHLNTQFEDGPWGELSRVESSKLIVQQVAALQAQQPIPAILTGDFNCNPWSMPYRILIDAGFTDTYRAAGHSDSAGSSTFHGFHGAKYFGLEWGGEVYWRVDWILARDGQQRLQTTSCTIVRDAEPPVYPSDHYPVVTELLVLP